MVSVLVVVLSPGGADASQEAGAAVGQLGLCAVDER